MLLLALSTLALTRTWWPSCPLSSSGLSTAQTLLSLSLTKTTFSPASMHFLAQSAWPALAPLAPHFESLTHPLIFVAFAGLSLFILSCANAESEHISATANSETASFFIFTLLVWLAGLLP